MNTYLSNSFYYSPPRLRHRAPWDRIYRRSRRFAHDKSNYPVNDISRYYRACCAQLISIYANYARARFNDRDRINRPTNTKGNCDEYLSPSTMRESMFLYPIWRFMHEYARLPERKKYRTTIIKRLHLCFYSIHILDFENFFFFFNFLSNIIDSWKNKILL